MKDNLEIRSFPEPDSDSTGDFKIRSKIGAAILEKIGNETGFPRSGCASFDRGPGSWGSFSRSMDVGD
jgi:hypothetical protein